MDIVNPQAQLYAEKYTSADDLLLQEVLDFTVKHHAHAHMISGHLQVIAPYVLPMVLMRPDSCIQLN